MSPDDILAALPYASEEVIPTLLTEYDRETLRTDLLACTKCPLSSATTPVPWQGDRTAISIIGEAPGAQEESMGVPFAGPSGNLLNSMLRDAGLARSEVATINTICCRPPENDYGKAVAVKAPDLCESNLIAQLDFTSSWLLVAMGTHALTRFKPKNPGITRQRGKPFWWQARLVVPTFHPAYALRDGTNKHPIIEDLRLARSFLRGEEPPECEQFDPSVVRGVRGPTDEAVVRHFDKHGWAIVFSPYLNARVAVHRHGVEVPDGWGHAYEFTPEWVAKMRGATPSIWSASAALFRQLGAVPV